VTETALKTPWYYILLALAGGDRHGQSIAREVLGLSDGRVRLWPATLYRAIETLEPITCSRRGIALSMSPRPW